MSRFLFVVLPLAGHVIPAGAIGRALAGNGHDVAYVGSQARLRPHLGDGAVIYPTGMRPLGGQSDTGTAAVRSLWQRVIVPLARHTLPAVEQAVRDYRPDVLVADQHALAGALIAERHGLPWASLCTSSMELAEPFAHLPKVDAWIRGHQASLRAMAGLPASGHVDLRFSPHLVLALTGQALLSGREFPGHYALVGPAIAARPRRAGFPWDRLDPARRKVLVTVGTLAESNATDPADFYGRVVAALEPLGDRVQAIVVAPDGVIQDPPGHVLVFGWVPQLELMPQLDAVVCHGGMNTVGEALSFAVPLVIAPVTRDQPIHASQVAAAGAGIRIRFSRFTPAQLRAALTAVLDDHAYRDAARRLRDSLAAGGGAPAAAEYLERLALPPPG